MTRIRPAAPGRPYDAMVEPATLALDVGLPAVPDAAARARQAVRAVARGHVPDLHAVDLVVSEAVTNAVVHAYHGRPSYSPGTVRVTAKVDIDELLITIADQGANDADADSPGAGLGLGLMATLADRFSLHQRPDGTRVVVAFELASDRPPPFASACSPH